MPEGDTLHRTADRLRPAPATALVNARVLTMDDGRPEASVLILRHGRVAAVGDTGLEAAHPDATVLDLGGRTVVPGFIDAHQHLSLAALHPRWADLAGAADLDEVRARLAAAARREPDAPWIRGCQWDEFDTGLAVTAADLDAMGFDRPVLVGCFSYHRAVVSSAGLDVLGRRAADVPDGLLVEQAWTAAHVASLAGYDDPDRWGELIAARAASLPAEGITAVHDAACSPEAEAVYRSLAAAGRLPVGVLVLPHGPILAGPDPARLDAGPPTGEGDELVRVGPVKLFADGGIDIAIDAHVGDHHIVHGELLEGLPAAMAAATERGYDVAVHAMGNRGLRATLDAWEATGAGADRRLRIEHVTLAGAGEIARMAGLGVTGVVQPGFVHLLGRNIGDLRFDDATWLPFADLLDAGVALAASSDGPCHITAPLVTGTQGATRLTDTGASVGSDQAVPLGEWLRLYTAGAADAGGQSGERGRLRPGLRADLVVLDGDVDLDGPGAVEVAQTWIAGERVV